MLKDREPGDVSEKELAYMTGQLEAVLEIFKDPTPIERKSFMDKLLP